METAFGGPIKPMSFDNPEWLLGDNALLRNSLAQAGAFKVQDDEYFEPDYHSINTDMTAVDQVEMNLRHQVEAEVTKWMYQDRVPLHVGKKLIRPSNKALFWNYITRPGRIPMRTGIIRRGY